MNLKVFKPLLISALPWLLLATGLFLYGHTMHQAIDDVLYSCGYSDCDARFIYGSYEQRVIGGWLILFIAAFSLAALTRQRLTAGILFVTEGMLTFYGLFALI